MAVDNGGAMYYQQLPVIGIADAVSRCYGVLRTTARHNHNKLMVRAGPLWSDCERDSVGDGMKSAVDIH